jgi:hypothetical protein
MCSLVLSSVSMMRTILPRGDRGKSAWTQASPPPHRELAAGTLRRAGPDRYPCRSPSSWIVSLSGRMGKSSLALFFDFAGRQGSLPGQYRTRGMDMDSVTTRRGHLASSPLQATQARGDAGDGVAGLGRRDAQRVEDHILAGACNSNRGLARPSPSTHRWYRSRLPGTATNGSAARAGGQPCPSVP